MTTAMQWLRRRFLAGFFVTVPVAVSIATFIWTFRIVDGVLGPLVARSVGRQVPGLGLAAIVLGVLAVGVFATNVIGKRLLQRTEYYLLKLPLFSAIYAPVRQLVAAFRPDNDAGFKRVVLVEVPGRGYVLGFLTREFTVEREAGHESVVAVYVPTNHLYLGDVLIFPRDKVAYPDLTVEQGIRIFLTGGMALGPRVSASGHPPPEPGTLP